MPLYVARGYGIIKAGEEMRAGLFDRKFGKEFIGTVPGAPGIYKLSDDQGQIIYVGKARNLRRRLQQYRNAKRCRKHRKMRAILSAAHAITLTPCATHLDAVLLENQLIQEFRPKLNVAGAFSFLYPLIGVLPRESGVALCYTTRPSEYPLFETKGVMFGAFRSRTITKEAFDALIELFSRVGHREPYSRMREFRWVKFSSVAGFRQIPGEWRAALSDFLSGQSPALLEQFVLYLIEKASARKDAESIQEHLDALKRFYRFEALPLKKALKATGLAHLRPLPQEDRDRVFLCARYRDEERSFTTLRSISRK